METNNKVMSCAHYAQTGLVYAQTGLVRHFNITALEDVISKQWETITWLRVINLVLLWSKIFLENCYGSRKSVLERSAPGVVKQSH